ncbi:ATP-binding cassette domain-containing protein [[Clostridium] polysaccharolyticum]|uniref:Putative ABC transport system ATP-binding protein n=1 Tax=[Clostridium] polysaccharolyticum TaxID=29364 RepID=A0A1I0FDT2_9FIRM|nr:ATP-binding cassette domain-containing protein [[Clostridium] polysaccharolyticum]SET56126.1 putative ABC transport system ATP-binding protein [[Clostridium] polysaccharolyticum]
MIEIVNLKKSFGDKVLFDNLNLSIKTGEFIVFSGASGCGKTTLLNMIGSLEEYNSGKIIVDGMDIRKRRNQQKYLSQKVGFLFQNFALVEQKTVKQNLNMIKKINRSGVDMADALEKVGLPQVENEKIYTLSGGEQQRIALARLIMKKCDLILCDEPTGSLDRENGKKIMGIIKEMNKEGKTVVLVTHDEEFKKEGSRIIEL